MFSSLFHQNFEIVQAVTPELIDEAHKLRYQVYCEEKGFEDAGRYPDQREYDEYDSRSIHSLIKHRHSGIYIGVVRLILSQRNDDSLLPVEQYCNLKLSESHPHLSALPRQSIGEISRFSISKVFRRRIAEQGLVWGICMDEKSGSVNTRPSQDRRHLPLISMGLIAALFQMCRDHNVHYCYAAMESALLRLLKSIGINFQPLSMPVEYHGMRIPSFFPVNDLLDVMNKQPELMGIASEVSDSAYSYVEYDCKKVAAF